MGPENLLGFTRSPSMTANGIESISPSSVPRRLIKQVTLSPQIKNIKFLLYKSINFHASSSWCWHTNNLPSRNRVQLSYFPGPELNRCIPFAYRFAKSHMCMFLGRKSARSP